MLWVVSMVTFVGFILSLCLFLYKINNLLHISVGTPHSGHNGRNCAVPRDRLALQRVPKPCGARSIYDLCRTYGCTCHSWCCWRLSTWCHCQGVSLIILTIFLWKVAYLTSHSGRTTGWEIKVPTLCLFVTKLKKLDQFTALLATWIILYRNLLGIIRSIFYKLLFIANVCV